MNTISSTDTVIIKTAMKGGDIYVEELRQNARDDADIQGHIDTLVSDRCTVTDVWLITGDKRFEDLSDRFDIRSADEIEDQSRRAERAAFDPHKAWGTYHTREGCVA